MIYQYRCPSDACPSNGDVMEIERGIKDKEQVYTCPVCGSALKRIFNTPSIQFIGKGFYKNGG